jgi:hypothetical protein
MSIEIKDARPPYVEFVQVPEEDREQTIETGSLTYKDVDFAHITPMGSKDRIERRVSDWFELLEREVAADRFPREWLTQYKAAYAAWKEGKEIPIEGTPLITWPVVSPAQLKTLVSLKLRSVEDLAQANEETLRRIGMGGVELKQRAANWLKAASGGKIAEQLTALQIRLTQLEERNKTLEEQNTSLKAQVKEPTK